MVKLLEQIDMLSLVFSSSALTRVFQRPISTTRPKLSAETAQFIGKMSGSNRSNRVSSNGESTMQDVCEENLKPINQALSSTQKPRLEIPKFARKKNGMEVMTRIHKLKQYFGGNPMEEDEKIPVTLAHESQSSKSRDKKRSEGEIVVKKLFVNDKNNYNHLFILPEEEATCCGVPHDSAQISSCSIAGLPVLLFTRMDKKKANVDELEGLEHVDPQLVMSMECFQEALAELDKANEETNDKNLVVRLYATRRDLRLWVESGSRRSFGFLSFHFRSFWEATMRFEFSSFLIFVLFQASVGGCFRARRLAEFCSLPSVNAAVVDFIRGLKTVYCLQFEHLWLRQFYPVVLRFYELPQTRLLQTPPRVFLATSMALVQ
eukprot:Gb_24070 [translate_table: standard]